MSNQRRPVRKRLAVVAGVYALVALSSACLAAGAGAASNTLFGFNSWGSTQNVSLQQSVGLPVRRMFVYWNQVERTSGTWDWSAFDQSYNAILAAGLQPEVTLFGSPCWARPSGKCDDASYTGPPDSTYDHEWTNFATQAAQRYGSAVGFEIWSEPNLVWLFYPKIDPARYAQLLVEASKAIKSVDPAMPVISAGLASLGTAGGATLDYRNFLSGVYAAGAGSSMDAIGIHVYPTSTQADGTIVWDPSQFGTVLNALRYIRATYHASQPIWVTEAGVSSSGDATTPLALTPAQQATDIMSMVRDAKAATDVGMLLVHTIQDAFADPSNPTNGLDLGWGAFTFDGTAKPLACQLSAAFNGSLHCALRDESTTTPTSQTAVTAPTASAQASLSANAGSTLAPSRSAAATHTAPSARPAAKLHARRHRHHRRHRGKLRRPHTRTR